MPIATNIEDTEKFSLKSAPPDGYVVLKRMTWGEKLARQAMVSRMKVMARRGSKDIQGELDMMTEQTALYEFSHCIVEHNLTDADGRMLDFTNSMHVKALTGRIGEEVSTYIGKMNNFEEEDEESAEGNS